MYVQCRSVRALVLLAAVTTGIAACSRDPVTVDFATPGEPAQIVLTEVAWAGGHEIRRETRIDSAAHRYTLRSCDDAPIGVPCTTLRLDREGDVVTPSMAQLFLNTKSAAFRALKAAYRRAGTVVPPDGGGATLEITADGRRRTIVWDAAANLPRVLVDFVCSLQTARGELLLCAGR